MVEYLTPKDAYGGLRRVYMWITHDNPSRVWINSTDARESYILGIIEDWIESKFDDHDAECSID